MNKAAMVLLTLINGSTALIPTFGQSRFSIAPTITFSYRGMNFTHQPTGGGIAARSTGSGAYRTVSGGSMVFYALNKQWSVSTGLAYSRYEGNEKINHYDGKTPVKELGSAGDVLQLPILINYTTSSHRLSPYLSAGAVLNYASTDPVASYLTQKRTNLADILVPPVGPPKMVRMQAMVGAGASYRLTPAVAVIVQPTASYEFGQPTADYSRYRVYQFGVQTQLKCSF